MGIGLSWFSAVINKKNLTIWLLIAPNQQAKKSVSLYSDEVHAEAEQAWWSTD